MLEKKFGENVRNVRKSKGLSQAGLARIANLTRERISKIENGSIDVTLYNVERISRALGVDYPDLLKVQSFLTNNPQSEGFQPKPFVKWAGGKTQIITQIISKLPKEYNRYFEPFVGGGALFFHLLPADAVINDSNSDLYNAYQSIKNERTYLKMLRVLEGHELNNSEEYYYQVRNMDRNENYEQLPRYVKAARMIYLNKACFNGLYRVNSNGFFNVPYGKKNKVVTHSKDNLAAIHNYLNNNRITIKKQDFEKAVSGVKKGDFVYFDPPYDVLEDKNTFTTYTKEPFGKKEQIRLALLFAKLDKKGVYVMLSNHNTSFIRDLYKDYNQHIVEAKRIINSDSSGRGNIEELIITNY